MMSACAELAAVTGIVETNGRSGKVIVRRGKRGGYRGIPLALDVRKALSAYPNQEHPDKKKAQRPPVGWLPG